MKIVLYTHSLVSDWNHGNAHFLRGVLSELQMRGHTAVALEPANGWSRTNLLAEKGGEPIARFASIFPHLNVVAYDAEFDHEAAIGDADVVLVHEWTDPDLVARIGADRRRGGTFTLVFHDTHHRGVSDEGAIANLPLTDYDVVLAFGEVLRARYETLGWGQNVFTWHEAADTHLFRPPAVATPRNGLIWIGNWGDGERAHELVEFLIEPSRRSAIPGAVHGVRYPPQALAMLRDSPLSYKGWIANTDVPAAFSQYEMTVHVPRRPYVAALPGIPTIRVFEALACGIPLISAPWQDVEGLFRIGEDFLMARDVNEMQAHMVALRNDRDLAEALRQSGLSRILTRHTCAHRVDELLSILAVHGTHKVRKALATEAVV